MMARIWHFWPWFILITTGTVWGLSFSLTKLATNTGAAVLGIAFWQTFLSGVFLLIYAYIRNGSLGIRRHHLRLVLAIALSGVLLPGVIFYSASRYVQPGILSIADTLVPMLTYGLALLIRLEKVSYFKLCGLVAGAIGILLLVLPESSLPNDRAVFWVLMSCLGAASYAFENIIIDRYQPEDLGPIRISVGMNLMAALILLPLAIYFDHLFIPHFPPGQLEWSIIGIAIISAVAYSSFVFLIVSAGPVFASQVGYMVTLSGVFWGIIIFDDSYSASVWLALLVMLAGLALVTPRRDKIPVPPSLPSGVKPFLPEQKSDHDNRKIDSD
jgi:drug/metabolite transporter (DMT)-like permease